MVLAVMQPKEASKPKMPDAPLWPQYEEVDARCWRLARDRFGWPPPREVGEGGDEGGDEGSDEGRERSRMAPPTEPEGKVNCFVVILKVLVAPSGEVVEVWPVRRGEDPARCEGHEKIAMKSVREWKMEPVLLQGKPAPVCMDVSVTLTPR